MESIVIDIRSSRDKVLLSALANRLRLKSRILSEEEKEEIGLLRAMEEGKNLAGRVKKKLWKFSANGRNIQ